MKIDFSGEQLEAFFDEWCGLAENSQQDDYFFHGASSFKSFLQEKLQLSQLNKLPNPADEASKRLWATNICKELAIPENDQVLKVLVWALNTWVNGSGWMIRVPKLKKENWNLVCDLCGATLAGHLKYRCPDDKGFFRPLVALRQIERNEGSFADDLPTVEDFDPEHCLCGEPIDYRCPHGLCKNCGNCQLCEELDRHAARQT